ncbi:MAG: 50S ribosome-binding GTPase, partial [Synergistaceae bacterium]|nr:50S ribosome-binding GTPase [Synergistaceae bacterium]
VGRPNVGKSALLNALVGDERAIVAELPGTTRDTVNAALVWRGLAMEFVDTAGIRSTEDAIEGKGIQRSLRAMEGADFRVVVIDSSVPVSDADRDIVSAAAGPAVIALNKSDLPCAVGEDDILQLLSTGRFEKAVRTSAIACGFFGRDNGIDDLKETIFRAALGTSSLSEGYAATERMTEALRDVALRTDDALEAMKKSAGVDVAGSFLAEASEIISRQLGADATEDLLNRIFSTFCVGK